MTINHNSLAMRLALIISLTIIIVFLIVGLLSYRSIYTQLLAHLTIETKMKEDAIARDIQNNFENARIITEQMAFNHEITTYLKTTQTTADIKNNPLYPSVLKTLIEIRDSNSTNFLVWIANEKANFYLDSNGAVPDNRYNVRKRPWYQVAMQHTGKATYTDPYVEWKSKKIVMSSIMALFERNHVYGFVVVDMKLEKLPDIFGKYTNRFSEKRFLIDKSGQYIYNPDKKLVLNKKYTIKNNQLKNYADIILSGKSSFQKINYNGSAYYLSSYPVVNTDWVIVSLVKESILSHELMHYTILLMILFGVTVTFLVVFVYLSIINKMKPIGIVADYASIIAAGDLSSNLPDLYLARKDEMGTLARAFQIITDTFRKENIILAEKINEKNMELKQQYKHIIENEKMAALGNLVAGVAHEINTPLGIGLSSASFINKINNLNRQKLAEGQMSKHDLETFMEQLNETTEILDNNLTRAAELIQSFKQIAVDQSSEALLNFNLKDTIDGVILSLRHEYKQQEHRLTNNCPDTIMLTSYPGAFSQVFTNLIMNSIQHAFGERHNGKIQFDCGEKDGKVEIIYTDDGKGISEEIIGKIYEPFFTTRRQQGNSGLGMHIVFNIVTQKLKGTIQCENKPEGGIKFTIKIPIAQ